MGKAERRLRRRAKPPEPKALVLGESKGSTAWRGLERLVVQNQLPRDEVDDFVVPPSPCGHCGELMDMATHAKGVKPKPGELAVCWVCTGVNRFGDDFRLAKMTEAEVETLDSKEYDVETLHEMRALIRAANLKSHRQGGDA